MRALRRSGRDDGLADVRWLYAAHAARAFGYGLAAVLLGATLAAAGLSPVQVGLVLTAVVAGTVTGSAVVGMVADRLGRRRTYLALYLCLGATGVVYAATSRWQVLVAVALLGVLSTDVVESGPFTTVEQAMLATILPASRHMVTGFGRYNAIAGAAGSLGALAAAVPALIRRIRPDAPAEQRYFLLLCAVSAFGAYAAGRLSPAVEVDGDRHRPRDARPSPDDRRPTAGGAPDPAPRLPVVWRLAGLFALDSFGGGFAVQAFLGYWLQHRYGATAAFTGVVMFGAGLLQTLGFLAAPRLSHHYGLLPTMVFTHLPANVLLAALAFAPTLGIAVVLLVGRTALAQMFLPGRQAYVMMLVPAESHTRAAAVTNTARYVTRPAGTALLGPAQLLAPGLPFLLAGLIKSAYDVTLWLWFRHVRP
jgi:predicted MFS family arabinose efflux permease